MDASRLLKKQRRVSNPLGVTGQFYQVNARPGELHIFATGKANVAVAQVEGHGDDRC